MADLMSAYRVSTGSQGLSCPYSMRLYVYELVASFLSRRSVSHGPRCKATAAYESSMVRKMRATPWQSVDGNARDRGVFWPVHSLGTDLAYISFPPLLQEVRSVYNTRNQCSRSISTFRTLPSNRGDQINSSETPSLLRSHGSPLQREWCQINA